MDNQILDTNIDEQKLNNEPRIFNWTVIIILWVFLLISFLNNAIFYPRIIFANLLLIISTIVCITRWNIGVRLVLLVLTLATFSIVSFLPYTATFSLHIGSIGFGFEIKYLFLLIFHVVLNNKWLNVFSALRMSKEEIEEDRMAKVNAFKQRISGKTEKELTAMMSNDKLVAEAREAAKDLLMERKNKQSL